MSLPNTANYLRDPLTDLAVPRYFDEQLEREFSRSQPLAPLVICVIDLDHFKQINDQYTHSAGDVALRAVADVLRSIVRERDVAARVGGEQFAVLLPNTNADQAMDVAEKLRSAIADCVVSHQSARFHVTVSIGCAERAESDASAPAFFARALSRVLVAKLAGRNCVRW